MNSGSLYEYLFNLANIMEKLTRKEREYKARREEILNAAERVFAQKGFHNTTVAEISKESEFAIGTIYQFFKNKEELYYTMMIEKFNLLYSTLQKEISCNKKFFKKLSCLVDVVFSFIEQNVDFFKIFTWELNVLKPNMENKLKKQLITKHFSYIKLISDVIKEGLHEGVLKEGDADDLSSALLGMMNIFSFNWIFNQQQDSLRAKAPVIVNLFLNGATRTDN
jgi:AcrR family transcriptional regulator